MFYKRIKKLLYYIWWFYYRDLVSDDPLSPGILGWYGEEKCSFVMSWRDCTTSHWHAWYGEKIPSFV